MGSCEQVSLDLSLKSPYVKTLLFHSSDLLTEPVCLLADVLALPNVFYNFPQTAISRS